MCCCHDYLSVQQCGTFAGCSLHSSAVFLLYVQLHHQPLLFSVPLATDADCGCCPAVSLALHMMHTHIHTRRSLLSQVASLRQRAYVLRLYALALLRCELTVMLEPVLAALLLDPAAAASGQGPQQNGFAAGLGGFTGQSTLNPYSTPAALLALQQICSVRLQVGRLVWLLAVSCSRSA